MTAALPEAFCKSQNNLMVFWLVLWFLLHGRSPPRIPAKEESAADAYVAIALMRL